MPYIITTKRPADPLTISDDASWAHTRTAVATLDEARNRVLDIAQRPRAIVWVERYISESGGTVGPLPDGTVIEVRWIDWMDFERMIIPGTVAATIPIATFDDDDYRDGLLRAFNAA
jgi:hypothetical protein